VSNIVKNFEGGAVDPSLFEHESERALWSAYEKVLPEADRLAKAEDYEGLFRLLGSLRQIIDRYFDDVLVMAEHERVRTNRLATCWTVNQLFRRLADFSLIVQA
jgi:glycyl-tRNA synthetase beta chain